MAPDGLWRAGRSDATTLSAIRVAGWSIAVGVLVLSLKAAAWLITGSAALYSDALESVVNVAASTLAFFALRYAERPADKDHPYGHQKAEFIAAGIEGALIMLAAVSILRHAWFAWIKPAPLSEPWRGIALALLASVFNALWAALLFRTARASRSPALAADAKHLVSDVVTSGGIAAGVALAVFSGDYRLDPVVAALTALYVLWSGFRLLSRSVDGLMDTAPSEATVTRIRGVVSANAGGAIEVHDLRTRHAGRLTFLQFHLVVPGSMRVDDAHEICDRIEAALSAEMGNVVVNIHVEPEHKAKHHGVLVL